MDPVFFVLNTDGGWESQERLVEGGRGDPERIPGGIFLSGSGTSNSEELLVLWRFPSAGRIAGA